ncbi:MAG: hypothetical protein WKF34_05035 [Pyrinomonadaceae bacterium]
MISGFNTDIEFGGTVYHVQTEDKGLSKRMIMSLVYDKGTILASKRVSYDDLSTVNFDEKELSERLGQQHKLICAAVKAGRIDELKGMAASDGRRAGIETASAKISTNGDRAVTRGPVSKRTVPVNRPQLAVVPLKFDIVDTPVVLRSHPPPPPPVSMNPLDLETVIDAVEIVEDVHILPAEAVAVVSEFSGDERSANTKLSLELLGDAKLKGGDRRTVTLMVCRGTDRSVVADAQIMIKVLGSSFRPVIFHAKSDGNGLAKIHLQLPHFQAGRAALLARVISNGEEIELRRAVTPG